MVRGPSGPLHSRRCLSPLFLIRHSLLSVSCSLRCPSFLLLPLVHLIFLEFSSHLCRSAEAPLCLDRWVRRPELRLQTMGAGVGRAMRGLISRSLPLVTCHRLLRLWMSLGRRALLPRKPTPVLTPRRMTSHGRVRRRSNPTPSTRSRRLCPSSARRYAAVRHRGRAQ